MAYGPGIRPGCNTLHGTPPGPHPAAHARPRAAGSWRSRGSKSPAGAGPP